MADRHMSIVDAHVILRSDGKILLLRRAGNVYASGQLCLPSSHHEAGESITATARETAELIWADSARLPPDTVDYAAKAISAIEQGCHFTLNGWDTSAAPA